MGAEAWWRWRSWRCPYAVDPILIAALCVGALLRSWCFGDLPAGMNQDEAAMAYDAYAIFHQGTDRLGIRFPTMLVSWGSGMNPLASYLVAPFVGIFGLSPWSARLPFLLAGVAGIPLFYVLMGGSSNDPAQPRPEDGRSSVATLVLVELDTIPDPPPLIAKLSWRRTRTDGP